MSDMSVACHRPAMDRGDAWLLGADIGPKQTSRSCLMMLSGACSAEEMPSDRIVYRDACRFSSNRHILVREIREASSDVGEAGCLLHKHPSTVKKMTDALGPRASALVSFGSPCKGATCHDVKGSLKKTAEHKASGDWGLCMNTITRWDRVRCGYKHPEEKQPPGDREHSTAASLRMGESTSIDLACAAPARPGLSR